MKNYYGKPIETQNLIVYYNNENDDTVGEDDNVDDRFPGSIKPENCTIVTNGSRQARIMSQRTSYGTDFTDQLSQRIALLTFDFYSVVLHIS